MNYGDPCHTVEQFLLAAKVVRMYVFSDRTFMSHFYAHVSNIVKQFAVAAKSRPAVCVSHFSAQISCRANSQR